MYYITEEGKKFIFVTMLILSGVWIVVFISFISIAFIVANIEYIMEFLKIGEL